MSTRHFSPNISVFICTVDQGIANFAQARAAEFGNIYQETITEDGKSRIVVRYGPFSYDEMVANVKANYARAKAQIKDQTRYLSSARVVLAKNKETALRVYMLMISRQVKATYAARVTVDGWNLKGHSPIKGQWNREAGVELKREHAEPVKRSAQTSFVNTKI